MSTEIASPITVGLVSLGCAKNLVDLQMMASTLLIEEYDLARNPDDADIILVNTCAFIQDARDEADEEIKRACTFKGKGRTRFVIVSGCLPQRYGKALTEKYPDVDAWIGIDHLFDLPGIVDELFSREAGVDADPIVAVSPDRDRVFEPPMPGFALTGVTKAYLKIAEGCNHACAYCAIPGIRGKLRSRLVKDIVNEARELISAGHREIILVAQDTTAYGKDLDDGSSLVKLVQKLDRIKGDHTFRILYGYPSLVTDELIKAIVDSGHFVNYIDIPIQHSHPEILKAMRRGGTAKFVDGMTARIRKFAENFAVRTTCLVGFPGETEEHFEHLLKHVRESEYDHLGVFCFSPEEGTTAASMDGAVPQDVAEKRRERLMLEQQKIVERRNQELIDTALVVRLTAFDGERWSAHADFQAEGEDGEFIVSDVPDEYESGDDIFVIVNGAIGYDFFASYITEKEFIDLP